MNTLKDRLVNRTNRVLISLDALAKLSKYGDDISSSDVSKIKAILENKLIETCSALVSGRDAIQFTLDD